MRRLLFINWMFILCWLSACGSGTRPDISPENKQDSLPQVDSLHEKPDSITTVPDTVEVSNDSEIKRTSKEPQDTPRAIIHTAPDQDKIDSIKNSKLKGKK